MDRSIGSLGAAATNFKHTASSAARQAATDVQKLSVWSRLLRRAGDADFCSRSEGCGSSSSSSSSSSGSTIRSNSVVHVAIALGIIIPVVAAAITFTILHRRSVKRMRIEDAKYREANLDYGLDDTPAKGKRLTAMFGAGGEKHQHKPGQLSMDLNLSSPYLLPPDLHQSRDSLHTLVKSCSAEPGPYRTFPLHSGSGSGSSLRSFSKGHSSPRGSEHHSSGSSAPTRSHSKAQSPLSSFSPTCSDQLSFSPANSDQSRVPTQPEPAHIAEDEVTTQVPNNNLPLQPIVPEIGTVRDPLHDKSGAYEMSQVAAPPAAIAKDTHIGLPMDDFRFELPATNEVHSTQPTQLSDELAQPHMQGEGLGIGLDLPAVLSPEEMPYQHGERELVLEGRNSYGQIQPMHEQSNSFPQDQPMHEHSHSTEIQPMHEQSNSFHQAQIMHEQSNSYPQIQDPEYYEDTAYPVEDTHGYAQGLGVPQDTVKRLSVGVVPLPPQEITQSEDPEYRANRIRSFYKEYFEDYADAPPLPEQVNYYEDYDSGYLGDAAYYDADSNTFVMPYAQPVTRRAMTPPPGGARRGPPGPGRPRGPSSIGGMSLPGGRNRIRAGSAGAFGRGPPKKRLPPPSALSTLPTPSKLRDDTALLNVMDFAPPESFKDQAAGRCQSPLGERRPYRPVHAAASPLMTAFDELSVLPSPHMLRKSSTFTGLDFAPPRKFGNPENMSDAGSIRSNRSNRSGISAVQLGAIRSGAGRVSRLPNDTVFAASKMDQLKPQWGMRQ